VTFLGDADGYSLIFYRIEPANHRSGRCQGDFMLAGAPTEKDADAKTFVGSRHLFVRDS
jgi:hypothetical protein